jgi:poly(3-hydroxybutyrate) depolymerase
MMYRLNFRVKVRKLIFSFWVVFGALTESGCATPASAGEQISRSFEIADIERQRVVVAHIYIPAKLKPDARVLVVMHGQGRTAEKYLETWKAIADSNGVVLVAPEFSRDYWPNSRHYNQGNMFVRHQKALKPRAMWGYTAMEKAVAIGAKYAKINGDKFYLYGHSAGGQFVHRYVMITGGKRLIRAVAANAGYYLWPDEKRKFPYGIRLLESHDWEWPLAFGANLTILAGSNDNQTNAKSLPRRAGAMVQGKHRLQRALNFFLAARAYAAKKEHEFNWRLETVPNVGHSNRGMSTPAARVLFGKMRPIFPGPTDN